MDADDVGGDLWGVEDDDGVGYPAGRHTNYRGGQHRQIRTVTCSQHRTPVRNAHDHIVFFLVEAGLGKLNGDGLAACVI